VSHWVVASGKDMMEQNHKDLALCRGKKKEAFCNVGLRFQCPRCCCFCLVLLLVLVLESLLTEVLTELVIQMLSSFQLLQISGYIA
jgi:hypothetical protein